jgi:ATP/maltotriose-dependent transcriptional regulator MalT
VGPLAGQTKAAQTYERPIVVRTRLLELLDKVQQRTVLLVAPAGYGKTTLARQWLERVGGGAWVGITPASADVAVFARDLAIGLASTIGLDVLRIESALEAGRTPSNQAAAVAHVLQAQLRETEVPWVVLDDYHVLPEASAADELVARLHESQHFNFVITSRARPPWATRRRHLYLETLELGARELALDEIEAAQLLPPDRRTSSLKKQARGWPAVIALAAHAQRSEVEYDESRLAKTLYEYFAEELFDRSAPDARRCLTAIAVLPAVTRAELADFARLPIEATGQAIATGLAYELDDRFEAHPLAREFLREKLRERADGQRMIRDAYALSIRNGLWNHAFDLVVEHGLEDTLEELIVAAHSDLLATGRITTLERWRNHAMGTGTVPQAVLDVLASEILLRVGEADRAGPLAEAAAKRLPATHPLKSPALQVAGQAAHSLSQWRKALEFHTLAAEYAQTSTEKIDSAWNKCVTSLHVGHADTERLLIDLESSPGLRPKDRVRVEAGWVTYLRVAGRGTSRNDVSELASRLVDPWVRTNWGNSHGSSLVAQARYSEAALILRRALAELEEYGLAFAVPHIEWTLAAAELGLRHFAKSASLLRRIEQHRNFSRDLYIRLNVRALRARIELAQQRPREALSHVEDDFEAPSIKVMYGEYLATRSLAFAVAGDASSARHALISAESMTAFVDAQMLCAATRAVLMKDSVGGRSSCEDLLANASRLGAWDAVICAVRAAPRLLPVLGAVPSHRDELRDALLRSNDVSLARTAGLITRAHQTSGVLSPREREIMDHVTQGMRNAEIAASLSIAIGTVKRHLDHIYGKLGARGRTEAIARYAEIETTETGDGRE